MPRLGNLAAVLLVLALASACSGEPPQVRPAAGGESSWSPSHVRAVQLLHDWDRRRSRAWAAQDPAGLRRLYVPGSTAATRDVALLREYADRGLRVPRLRMQVLRAAVVVDRPGRVVLRVTERLGPTEVDLGSGRVRLPRDRAQSRVVELRKVAGEWRLASVRPTRR
jgi:hypothetical protein